jgi:hypothetical protein
MATKSILKDVYIRNSKDAKKLVDALENASNKTGKDVALRNQCREVRGKDIAGFFGGEKCQNTAE